MPNNQVKLKCANENCGKDFAFVSAGKSGIYNVKCPYCAEVNEVTVRMPALEKTVVCVNADCRKRFAYRIPPKAGRFTLACPYCQVANPLEVKTAPETEPLVVSVKIVGVTLAQPKVEEKPKPRVEEAPKPRVEDKPKQIEEEAPQPKVEEEPKPRVEEEPKPEHWEPEAEAEHTESKAYKRFEEREANEPVREMPEIERSEESSGMALVTGGIFSKRRYELTTGVHIVGRYDKKGKQNSDFELKDSTVSLRSVRIDVAGAAENYKCHLTVLRAFNPVTINGVEIQPNQTAVIRHGDTIQLGLTKIKVV